MLDRLSAQDVSNLGVERGGLPMHVAGLAVLAQIAFPAGVSDVAPLLEEFAVKNF